MREQFRAKLTKSASTSISRNLRWTNSIWFPTTMGKNGSRATNYSNNIGVMWKSFGWNDGENVKKICVKRTTWKSRNGSWRPNVSSSKYSSHFDQSNKLLCGRWGRRRQAKPYHILRLPSTNNDLPNHRFVWQLLFWLPNGASRTLFVNGRLRGGAVYHPSPIIPRKH
jgi:hypothetical protein